MAEKKVMLTQDGYDELVKKLDYLKSVRRIEVADRLKAAIALGDLSENSEYDDAKNEQAFLEGEIFDLEAQIVNSQIIQHKGESDIIDIGNTVVIREVEEISGETYGKIKSVFNNDGEEIDKPEVKTAIYKIKDNDFIDIGNEPAYKLISAKIEEIDDEGASGDNIYLLIEGGLLKVTKSLKDNSSQLYKIIDGEATDFYGKLENIYKVYEIVEEDEKYRIVGSTETNPDEGKISDESPLGKALLGKKSNHIVEVNAPAGIIYYEIVKIES